MPSQSWPGASRERDSRFLDRARNARIPAGRSRSILASPIGFEVRVRHNGGRDAARTGTQAGCATRSPRIRLRMQPPPETVSCACQPSSERRADPKRAAAENAGAETSASLQCGLGSGPEGLIHPIARSGFFNAEEPDTLQFKFPIDQRI